MKLGMNAIPLDDIYPLNASICGHQQYQDAKVFLTEILGNRINPYPTAFPYGNGMVLHFYQQQGSSTTKTVHSH